MSKDNNHMLLELAKEAAIEAGVFLKNATSSLREVHQQSRHDVKIKADLESEKKIIRFLQKNTEFPILTEEAGFLGNDQKSFYWVVDPLDGTINYYRGIPICCVSIGLWHADEPILGVIYDFNKEEIFSGISNEGAWLNGAPLQVSRTEEKEKAILLTGFPAKTDLSNEAIGNFISQVQAFRKLRLIGSAALSVAYVACGRADAYYEKNIALWDVAGGIPLVKAAGGDIKIEKTQDPHYLNIIVSNGKLR